MFSREIGYSLHAFVIIALLILYVYVDNAGSNIIQKENKRSKLLRTLFVYHMSVDLLIFHSYYFQSIALCKKICGLAET